MAEHVVCDRCGKSVKFLESEEYGQIGLQPYHPPLFNGDPLMNRHRYQVDELQAIQLCERCCADFQVFLNTNPYVTVQAT